MPYHVLTAILRKNIAQIRVGTETVTFHDGAIVTFQQVDSWAQKCVPSGSKTIEVIHGPINLAHDPCESRSEFVFFFAQPLNCTAHTSPVFSVTRGSAHEERLGIGLYKDFPVFRTCCTNYFNKFEEAQ